MKKIILDFKGFRRELEVSDNFDRKLIIIPMGKQGVEKWTFQKSADGIFRILFVETMRKFNSSKDYDYFDYQEE